MMRRKAACQLLMHRCEPPRLVEPRHGERGGSTGLVGPAQMIRVVDACDQLEPSLAPRVRRGKLELVEGGGTAHAECVRPQRDVSEVFSEPRDASELVVSHLSGLDVPARDERTDLAVAPCWREPKGTLVPYTNHT